MVPEKPTGLVHSNSSRDVPLKAFLMTMKPTNLKEGDFITVRERDLSANNCKTEKNARLRNALIAFIAVYYIGTTYRRSRRVHDWSTHCTPA